MHRAIDKALVPLCILFTTVLVRTPAYGQFQIPGLEGEAPKLQIASPDDLENEIRVARTKLQRVLAARDVETKRVLESLDEKILQAESGSSGDESVDDLRHHRELVENEVSTLKKAAKVAAQALDLLKGPGEARPQKSVSVDELLELELTRERFVREAARARELAERLGTLAASVDASPRATGAIDLAVAESFLQSAQASLARSEALLAEVRLRRATDDVQYASTHLATTKEAVKSSEDRLKAIKAEAEIARAALEARRRKAVRNSIRIQNAPFATRNRVREEERSLRLAKLAELAQQEETFSVRLWHAEELLKLEREAEQTGELSGVNRLTEERLAAERTLLQKQQDETQSALVRVIDNLRAKKAMHPTLQRLLKERKSILEASLNTLLEKRRYLERLAAIAAVKTTTESERSKVSIFWATLQTIFLLLLTFSLLNYGLRRLGALGKGRQGFFSTQAWARLRMALALIGPIVLVGLVGALIVWPIWRLPLTLDQALSLFDRPLFFVDEQPVSLFSIVKLLFSVWVAVVVSRLARDFLDRRVYQRMNWDIGITNAFNTFVSYLSLMIGVVVGLRFVGIGLSSLAIFAGVLGIGIGFGLRNVTENFISGLIILVERPIKIGDFIDVGGEVEGQIREIRARSTTVVTRDNISIIIPNSDFVAQRVTNWSHGDPRVRLTINVGVAYGSDTDLVRRTLLDVAERHGKVLKKPSPEVHFVSFGESSLDFSLLVWIDEQHPRFRIASDLHFAIDKAFRRMHIEIAFPQRDLHVRSVEHALPIPGLDPPPLDGPSGEGSNDTMQTIPPGRPGSRIG